MQTTIDHTIELPSGEEFDPTDALKSSSYGPAVYIGFWGLYNGGDLYGNWCDLQEADTAEKIQACIDFLRLKFCPDKTDPRYLDTEEWMFQDSEYLPSFLRTENPDLSQLESYVEAWMEIPDGDEEAYQVFCENDSQVHSTEEFREAYRGAWDSGADFAEDYYEQQGVEIHSELASYIDWERVWHGEFECADGWSVTSKTTRKTLVFIG
jgi:antirestriction protein